MKYSTLQSSCSLWRLSKIILALALIFIGKVDNAWGQYMEREFNMPSANAASLGLYGEVPVSLYTGTANINVPIYTIEDRKIKIPISLSYHSSGVRVNQHPGWVGLNWSLNAGGIITRKRMGYMDEGSLMANTKKAGYYYWPESLQAENWNTRQGVRDVLADKILKAGEVYYDTEPDEFSFNFLGYSGEFYRSGNGWKAVSETDIKIENTDMLDIPFGMHKGEGQHIPESFGGFILTTSDGMRYHFGGVHSAIEYTMPFFEQRISFWTATSWMLTKVEAPEGYSVTFEYALQDSGKHTASFHNDFQTGTMGYFFLSDMKRLIALGPQPYSLGGYSRLTFNRYSGTLQRPVYLSKIQFSQGYIDFSRSNTTELKYPNRVLQGFLDWLILDQNLPEEYDEVRRLDDDAFPYLRDDNVELPPNDLPAQVPLMINQLVWQKLDSISIKQNDNHRVIKRVNLEYSNETDKRLMLKKVSFGKETCKENYNFLYHNEGGLPEYCDEYDKTDHWGFFNNRTLFKYQDIITNTHQFFDQKQPSTDINILKAGTLAQIMYPTGGTTQFNYEPHTIYKYKVVNSDGSLALTSAGDQKIGGIRIKEIVDNDGTKTKKRTYSYLWNNGSANISSGISNGLPLYQLTGDMRYADADGNPNGSFTNRTLFMTNNTLPMSANSMGSHIGYRQITETNEDSSYTVYKYTNYESDDTNHMDGYILEQNKYGTENNIYDPQIDRSLERGKLLSLENYSSAGQTVFKKILSYAKVGLDSVRAVRALRFEFQNITSPVSSYIASPYAYYAYKYRPKSEYVYQYDQEEASRFTLDSTRYIYNAIGLATEITTWRGGKMTKTKNKYVSDYLNDPSQTESAQSVLDMKERNMLGVLIERQLWNNEKGSELMVDGEINLFRRYNANAGYKNIQLEKKYRFATPGGESNVPLSRLDGDFLFNTKYSNLLVDFGSSNSNGYYPDGNPKQFTGADGINQNFTWGTGAEIGLLKSKTVGDETTSVSYGNPLVGVSTITDPKGMVTNYYYDSFNRLSEIKELHGSQEYLIQSLNYNLNNASGCAQPSLQNSIHSNVLIVGNSITKLIAQSDSSDGWRSAALIAAGGWGRASSTKEKDFAHILESRFKQLTPTAQVLPLWEAPFERDYVNNVSAGWLAYDYNALQGRIANGFGSPSAKPDLIIIRLGENVLNSEVEPNNFKGALNTLIDKVLEVSTEDARVILTNSMWPDQPLADAKIQEVANERGYPFVDLSDMFSNPIYLAGNDPATLAAFPNNLNDKHPGDAGMLEIADRIWSKIQNTDLPSNIGGNITKVRLHPRTDCCIENIVGSVIQASNDLSNTNGWTTLATINETPSAGWNEFAIRTTTAWRYLRFLAGPNSSGELKELEFYNGNSKLTGSTFGSSATLNNDSTNYGYGVVFDNQVDTKFWQGSAPGPQNYAGIDLGLGCSLLTGSVISPANNATVEGTASTITAGRVITAISINACSPTGSTINSVEVWGATSTGGFATRMGYAIADPSQPGVYTLSAQEGSEDGKWPIAYLDPDTYRFYAVINSGTSTFTTDYITITLTPAAGACPVLTGSLISPTNNATVEGVASTTTAGRVITAVSVSACAPTGFTISSVEVWAATSTGGFPNRMGYAVADPSQPGIYTLSALEGSEDGKWPTPYLAPNTYRFYAVINSGTSTFTTDYITIDLTEPTGTTCPSLTGSVISPVNNATVEGTASTTTAGRVTTTISVSACAPTGFTISSVEVWAATSTGGFPNRMGYAVADPSQPGVYTLSAQEGSEDGKWPIPYLAPNTYRFYAVINSGTVTFTTDYITINLTEPTGTTCPALTGNVISPANNATVEGTASTITAGRVTAAISVNACAPSGFTITSVEVWAATSFGGFATRMGYAVADPSQPGVYTLSALEGIEDGKWAIPYLDPDIYRFYAVIKSGTSTFTTDYITITLTPPAGACSALTGSVISPANNATVEGIASTTTAGQVTTAISVNACAPTGLTISSVEVWAATSTGGFANRMGYAVADPSQPGVYILSALEGSEDGKWPVPYLAPNTYRFYAIINTGSSSFTTDYIMINLTEPAGTCSSLTGGVISPANNAGVVGTPSTTSPGQVTTAISVSACAPTGSTISSVEVWAATSTGGFATRMGYAVANPGQPGVYTLSAQEGSDDGKWPVPYLAPNTYRFYAVINTGSSSFTTDYISVTLTEPPITSCSALTGSVISPANNVSVVGTASTTTTGRVTTAININACAPTGSTINSVEVWAATSTGGFATRMGYAVADPNQPGVYTLSSQEGSEDGKWPVAYLEPDTYRFYAVINTGTSTYTTDYIMLTMTAP